jgi:hypothetical protein
VQASGFHRLLLAISVLPARAIPPVHLVFLEQTEAGQSVRVPVGDRVWKGTRLYLPLIFIYTHDTRSLDSMIADRHMQLPESGSAPTAFNGRQHSTQFVDLLADMRMVCSSISPVSASMA